MDRRLPSLPFALAAALVALALPALDARALASGEVVVEVEPNDDAGDEAYAGAVAIPAAPSLVRLEGSLADAADFDAYRLDGAAPGPTVLLLSGLGGQANLVAQHVPNRTGDRNALSSGYGARIIERWSVAEVSEERVAFCAVDLPTSETEDAYRLDICQPAPGAETATLSAVFKDVAQGDSFKAKIKYAEGAAPALASDGCVVVAFRDYREELDPAAFTSNGAGTVFKYKGATGVRKVVWNTRTRTVQIQGKGIDFAAAPETGHLLAALLGDGGGCAAEATGTLKGTAVKRLVAKRK